jgi:KaiC/GvpD/RAD55 family RecA-like ATPase
MSDAILTTALRFAAAGISAVPVAADGSKRPGLPAWTAYQKKRPTPEELMGWFGKKQDGVGIICGAVSGNLEMLELEGRAVAKKLHIELREIFESSEHGHLWTKLVNGYMETTPSGGIHWLYRISDGKVPGNTKIAQAAGEDGGCLAETRGEGGFVITAPSGGKCHPSGNPWQISAGSIETIPTFTIAERQIIHQYFALYDEVPKAEWIEEETKPRKDGIETPGDAYNETVTWESILEPLGWSKVYSKGESTAWRRPGKTEGISATTNFNGNGKLFVFSTSTIFTAQSSYSKFAAYTQIEHKGDFKAAASHLRSQGFGAKTELRTDWQQIEAHNPSHVQLHDENEEIATSSWIPQDITDMQLEDEPPPSVLKREDGNFILYANKINAIFGESESGKTWIAIEAVRQELAKGHCVFYLDFEDSARGIRGRLKTMGVASKELRHFRYANPDEGLTRGVVEVIQSEIQIHKPSLIVIDGVNAAMNLLGLDLEKNKDATTFSQLILRPLRMENACILTIDHVTKSKDTRGNYAIGAQAKRADIDGVAIAVDVAMPFGRGLDGCLNLKVTKDRPGFVRAICQDAKDLGVANLKSNKDGTITVTISGGTIVVTTKEQKLQEISNFFEQTGAEIGQNDIRKGLRQEGIEIGNQELGQALEQLIAGGFIDFRKQGQKYLYKFKNQFMIGDVNAWEAE